MGHFKLIGPGTDGLYKYGGATIELSSLGTRRWYVTIRFKSQEVDLDEYRSSNEALEAAMAWVDAAPEHPRDFHGRPRPLGEMRYPKLEPPEPHFVSPREERDPRARFARPIHKAPSTSRQRPRATKREFHIGQDVEMISNPTNIGHVVGFDPDGSVMVQWSGSRVVTGVAPNNLRVIGRGYAGQRMETTRHRVADFNTLDDLVAHARGEGATHVLQIDDETHIYFKRRDGSYEKAEAWQKDGYWHTQAPGSRAVVRKPPPGAKPIGGTRARGVEAPRRSAHHHPGQVALPKAGRSAPRRR